MSETNGNSSELTAALVKAQAAFPPIKREQTAQATATRSYKYADLATILDAVRGPLAANGLAIVQPIRLGDNHHVLVTRLLHVSGASLESEYALANHERPQEMGSEITYARRYALSALLGVASEDDDDGKAAQESDTRTTSRPIDGEAPIPFDYDPPEDMPDPRPDFLKGAKVCPYCKKPAIIKGKAEYGGGWLCFQKRGGCGQKWSEMPQTASGKPVDTATGEVKEDDRPFLLGAVIRGLKGFSGTQRGELFTVHLDGNTPEKATRDQLHALYVFLGDDVKVAAWLKAPTPA